MVVRSRTARAVDGAVLAMSIQGEGTPLLLIAGLGATRRVFDPLAPLLARRHQVITYDPRGVGDSSAGTLTLTLPQLADDAVAVLDAAEVASANVFGASMGGVVAQHLAVRSDTRVRSLVLAATSPGGRKAVPASPSVTAALLGKGGRTPEEAYRIACTVLYSPRFQRTHQAFIDEQVRVRAAHPVSPRVFTAQLRALDDAEDISAALHALDVPTLVMHGTADIVTPIENAYALASMIPRARTRWFEDCGHLFFHERPEESARVTDEFLRERAQASASG